MFVILDLGFLSKQFVSFYISFYLILLFFFMFLSLIFYNIWCYISFYVCDSAYNIIPIKQIYHIKSLFINMFYQILNLKYSRYIRIITYIAVDPKF